MSCRRFRSVVTGNYLWRKLAFDLDTKSAAHSKTPSSAGLVHCPKWRTHARCTITKRCSAQFKGRARASVPATQLSMVLSLRGSRLGSMSKRLHNNMQECRVDVRKLGRRLPPWHLRGVNAQTSAHAKDVGTRAAGSIILSLLPQPHHRPPNELPHVLHHHVPYTTCNAPFIKLAATGRAVSNETCHERDETDQLSRSASSALALWWSLQAG